MKDHNVPDYLRIVQFPEADSKNGLVGVESGKPKEEKNVNELIRFDTHRACLWIS